MTRWPRGQGGTRLPRWMTRFVAAGWVDAAADADWFRRHPGAPRSSELLEQLGYGRWALACLEWFDQHPGAGELYPGEFLLARMAAPPAERDLLNR
jgi:hypothetical protein